MIGHWVDTLTAHSQFILAADWLTEHAAAVLHSLNTFSPQRSMKAHLNYRDCLFKGEELRSMAQRVACFVCGQNIWEIKCCHSGPKGEKNYNSLSGG